MPPIFEYGPAGKNVLDPKSIIDLRNDKGKIVGRINISESGESFTYFDEYGLPHPYWHGESTNFGSVRYSSERPKL
jgi:hypothetical protein